jgi:recombination protein RecA
MGLLKKSGAFYSFGELRLGQGRENAKEFLRQNHDVRDAVEQQIRANVAEFQAAALTPVPEVMADAL